MENEVLNALSRLVDTTNAYYEAYPEYNTPNDKPEAIAYQEAFENAVQVIEKHTTTVA